MQVEAAVAGSLPIGVETAAVYSDQLTPGRLQHHGKVAGLRQKLTALLASSCLALTACESASAPPERQPTAGTAITQPSQTKPTFGSGPATSRPGDKAQFMYAGGYEYVTTEGAAVSMSQARPHMDENNGIHSLMELAVESADRQQIVEVGWTVEPAPTPEGNTLPRLFVSHWVNGVRPCPVINDCDFVWTAKEARGKVVDVTKMGRYAIEHTIQGWQVSHNGKSLGYFEDRLWPENSFTTAGLVQVFGEVVATSRNTCTAMGNGKFPDDSGAAKFLGFQLIPASTPAALSLWVTDSRLYGAYQSGNELRIGGPGACKP